MYSKGRPCTSDQGKELSVASPIKVPVSISQESLAYWNVDAPRNAMVTGQEVQAAEQRKNNRDPMVQFFTLCLLLQPC